MRGTRSIDLRSHLCSNFGSGGDRGVTGGAGFFIHLGQSSGIILVYNHQGKFFGGKRQAVGASDLQVARPHAAELLPHVGDVMMAVARFSRAGRIGARRPCGFGCSLRMRIEHGKLGIEIGLDLGERDLALRLHLKMDGLVLRLLLGELRLVRRCRGIDLALACAARSFGSGGGAGGAGGGCKS